MTEQTYAVLVYEAHKDSRFDSTGSTTCNRKTYKHIIRGSFDK